MDHDCIDRCKSPTTALSLMLISNYRAGYNSSESTVVGYQHLSMFGYNSNDSAVAGYQHLSMFGYTSSDSTVVGYQHQR
jgi:hypothetical protein